MIITQSSKSIFPIEKTKIKSLYSLYKHNLLTKGESTKESKHLRSLDYEVGVG